MSLLPDKGIHLQPDQLAFRVVVQTAAPTLPSRSHQPQRLHGAGSIFERTPSASSTVVKHGRSLGQRLAILFRRPELRSRCEHVAEVFGKPFVDPEQITDHWLLVIRRRQAGWAAVLSIPGVDELMRQQAHFHQTQLWINQRAFGHAVVAGFVMLESVMAHFVAQCVEKVILGVMPGTEQRARLGHQQMVSGGLLRRHGESSFALADHIDDVHWELPGLRSEEHTSELQSLAYLVCRLLLEKKKYFARYVIDRSLMGVCLQIYTLLEDVVGLAFVT